MFVRKKVIKGRGYFYLVRSVRRGSSVRQECLEYLGAKLPSKKEMAAMMKKHSKRSK